MDEENKKDHFLPIPFLAAGEVICMKLKFHPDTRSLSGVSCTRNSLLLWTAHMNTPK